MLDVRVYALVLQYNNQKKKKKCFQWCGII